MKYNFYVYILTNYNKTVLYIGVTNNLQNRLFQHKEGINDSFTKKYKCFYLLHYKTFSDINDAIKREKQLKRWSRIKKDLLISTYNPAMKFLNEEI